MTQVEWVQFYSHTAQGLFFLSCPPSTRKCTMSSSKTKLRPASSPNHKSSTTHSFQQNWFFKVAILDDRMWNTTNNKLKNLRDDPDGDSSQGDRHMQPCQKSSLVSEKDFGFNLDWDLSQLVSTGLSPSEHMRHWVAHARHEAGVACSLDMKCQYRLAWTKRAETGW